MAEKVCRKCGATKSLDDYYVHSQMADGHLNICKECTKERVRRHRFENDHVREQERMRYAEGRKRGHAAKWHAAHPERIEAGGKARWTLNNAIRDGKVVRPTSCEECGASGVPIEGAHWDYSRPFDVRWLCRRCHRRWDAAAPKTLRAS